MPSTSPFFSNIHGYSGETGLVDDLVREQIKLFGMDVMYMPRRNLNLDKLLHESSKSAFEFAMPIPMYVKSFSGYQNGMELLTKFGVRSSDEITMVMSRSEFETYYAPYIKSYNNAIKGSPVTNKMNHLEGETDARPKEGDLIYFPFDDGIFEIKYVMFDQPFFQFGQNYTFEIQCEKFEYSGETFDTGIPQIDDSMIRPSYSRLELEMAEGDDSFQQFETVKIYDLSRPSIDENPVDFRLYKDPGFLGAVPEVTAKVMEWDAKRKRLILGDLSDYDPLQMDGDTGDISLNKFDDVVVIGDTTGAAWVSLSAVEHEQPFDDTATIQNEFNNIKILDLGDENPFGFY